MCYFSATAGVAENDADDPILCMAYESVIDDNNEIINDDPPPKYDFAKSSSDPHFDAHGQDEIISRINIQQCTEKISGTSSHT